MILNTRSVAKVVRPKVFGTVNRERLLQLLDQGKQKSVVWLAAQAGSGKTTLVADWLGSRQLPSLWYQVDEGDADIASFFYYMGLAARGAAPRYRKSLPVLTAEYLQGIPAFTRRYFEELFRRLASLSATARAGGFVIVLDNYQDAPVSSGFHDVIARGMDSIPEGITFVVLSRAAPPSALSRLQANSRLCSIGWEDIRFTREESLELLQTQGHGKLSAQSLDMLHDKTEGWAAGLILLTGAGKTASTSSTPVDLAPDKLFDYFASEIFDKADAHAQDFLLKTSFLQRVIPAIAEKLTGNAKAGKILERMSKGNYFTQKYGEAYQYHPLFQEFLRSRAQAIYSASEMAALQQSAAMLLEESGNTEEAVEFYIAASDWAAAKRITPSLAPILISQGRSLKLEAWLNSLPLELVDHAPWLQYWLAICRIAYDPPEARGYLEKAFLHFKNEDSAQGVFLAWASIIDTIVYEWSDFHSLEHWVAEADKLIADYPEFPSVEIEARVVGGMLSALTWSKCGHADLPMWADKARQIVLDHSDKELRARLGNILAYYYLFSGQFAKVALLMDVLRPISNSRENATLTRLSWLTLEVNYAWSVLADNKMCVDAVTKGMKLAQEQGIHLLDLQLLGMAVFSGVSLGDTQFARICQEKMAEIDSPRVIDKSFFHYQTAAVAWCLGDLKKSIEHGRLALQIIEPTGCKMPHVLTLNELALSLFDDGQHAEAQSLLVKQKELGLDMPFFSFARLLYGARFAFELGDENQGFELLKQGLAIGAQHGYINMYRWHNRSMSRLCAKALEYGIETAYVQKLIKARSLVPEGIVDNWPYPIRICSLGRFEVLRHGAPLAFAGKVQKKPIELLKALVSFGEQGVSEERLVDALWPGSDGDAAHNALKTTIMRLRQLLGSDQAVVVSGGTISLDTRLCYVDAFAFEKLMKASEVEAARQPPTLHSRQFEIALKTLALYQGRFLPADTACAWTMSPRERLQSKFLRFNLRDGKALEENHQWAEAIDRYHRALEVDDLCEEFYQRLMYCHLQLGQQTEALAIYQRCKQILLHTLGAPVSDLTAELYQAASARKA